MAKIIDGGPPINDGERRVIAHLRDNAPDDWLVLHNIEVPVRGGAYEVDLLVVTGHGVCIVDVKGTRGRIEVAGSRWFPSRGAPFYSPVRKLRGHARALKGVLERARPRLAQLYVDQLVVLIAPDARLVDPNDRSDADALDVVDLPGLIPALADVSRVRAGMSRDIRAFHTEVLDALHHGVRESTGPRRFGNWEVIERLSDHGVEPGDDVAEYRARNASAPAAGTVLLRVYRADPFLQEAEREAQRIAIANAYDALARMPPHPCVVGRRDFFPIEDESRYVLVLDDVPGQALTVHLSDPRQALGADARIRVVADLLRSLAHAHAHGVLHRALGPSVMLVTGPSGQSLLTGFDYARPEGDRAQTVARQLAAALDSAYVAPECQSRVQAMSRASDVYAAGVVAFRLLTGELPFATTAEQHSKGSELPEEVMRSAALAPGMVELLRRMCRLAPSARPTAIEALSELNRLTRHNALPTPMTPTPAAHEPPRPDYRNLPEGFQLTRKLTVRRRLGKNGGGFATAYQVYDSIAAEDRVAKIVHRDRESVIDRLRLEYQTLRRLPPHRSIVKVEEADFLDGGEIPYLLLEYVPGQEVSELVDDRSLGPADAVRLGIDVAEGLVFLHTHGVYHCDIKPTNLLRTDDGCKIFDFNVAVTADSTMGRVGGTSKYSPVDFGSYGDVSAVDLADRDVYALGLTVYEVLTGRWPFPTGSRSLAEQPLDPTTFTGLGDLSEELVQVLRRAIAPLRADRYPTAAEFLAALSAVADRVHRPHEALTPPTPIAVPGARPTVNPFVDYLRTVFSQSTDSNAGTRGGSTEARFDLYVSTLLDERLTRDVLAGLFRLVIITGNAGDGKTEFLDRLLAAAVADGPANPVRHTNGAEFYYQPSRLRLRTNSDGSQDEGDRANDDVLLEFFAPFGGHDLGGIAGETRLIAINEGRLVDFLTTHRQRFPALAERVRYGLDGWDGTGAPDVAQLPDGLGPEPVLVVNLNRRSLLSGRDDLAGPVFDRLLARMTHENQWAVCGACPLARTCYARHNALTFSHPSAGPKIIYRLRQLYQLTELRGVAHLTIRDVRSALAYMLTSARSCEQIHELYGGDHSQEILDGFYFSSWAGPVGTKDRLLALLAQVDVAGIADPALDRRLDYVGPNGGRAVMTVDQRGDYDQQLLGLSFARLPRGNAPTDEQANQHRRYLAAARRRFYFECVDDKRARRMLPYRSANDFLALLADPERTGQHLPEIIQALNRSEGMGDGTADGAPLRNALALQTRTVPGGTIRGYRLFPADQLTLTVADPAVSPYIEGGAQELLLRHHAPSGHVTQLQIRLDLFELLTRLRDGYLPSVAEQQGLHLGLTIFKHELSSAPYQQILLTITGRDLYWITRQPDGKLVMADVLSLSAHSGAAVRSPEGAPTQGDGQGRGTADGTA